MTTLLVSAQDIRSIALGLVTDGTLTKETEEAVGPERYLEAVVRALGAWGVKPADLDAIAVVPGPGAFTASRVSTVIANALAFAGDLPVISVENPKRLPLKDLAVSLPSSRSAYAVPVYDRPPNITVKK